MHAVLITAYKDFPVLERLVKRFDPGFFVCHVHVDVGSQFGAEQLQKLRDLGCLVSRKYRIRWGEINHLHALLHLLGQAVARPDVDYVHLISGEDYPIASPKTFQARCDGRIFMNFEPLASARVDITERYSLYHLFHGLQGKWRILNPLNRHLTSASLKIQRWIGVRRRHVGPVPELFKGIVWMSFPVEAGRKVIQDDMARSLLAAVRTTFIPEEIFLQSYFLNSDLRSLVVNDDLRFTDWHRRNGSVPAYLDETDTAAVLGSNALFARKVSSALSSKFLDRIDEALAASA